MVNHDIEVQLRAILPSSLDEVIRLNRDKVSLRFSTEADLQMLAATIPSSTRGRRPNLFAVPISRWQFVTLDVHITEPFRQTVHLFGRNDVEARSWNTSPVLRLDRSTGRLITRSGTLYRLHGGRGANRDLDLLQLCAYLHTTSAGGCLGVPAILF